MCWDQIAAKLILRKCTSPAFRNSGLQFLIALFRHQISDAINYWGEKGKGVACSRSGSPPKIAIPMNCLRLGR